MFAQYITLQLARLSHIHLTYASIFGQFLQDRGFFYLFLQATQQWLFYVPKGYARLPNFLILKYKCGKRISFALLNISS